MSWPDGAEGTGMLNHSAAVAMKRAVSAVNVAHLTTTMIAVVTA